MTTVALTLAFPSSSYRLLAKKDISRDVSSGYLTRLWRNFFNPFKIQPCKDIVYDAFTMNSIITQSCANSSLTSVKGIFGATATGGKSDSRNFQLRKFSARRALEKTDQGPHISSNLIIAVCWTTFYNYFIITAGLYLETCLKYMLIIYISYSLSLSRSHRVLGFVFSSKLSF